MTTTLTQFQDPDIDTSDYEAVRHSGADRETLVRNLVESNFHGLRRLQAYVMAGLEKRKAFTRDLARGRAVDSCPFPLEVALLRALHMGLARWRGTEETADELAQAYLNSMRFGIMAPHLTCVVEYEPEVFFRAFQGMEVHRDVPFLEDSSDEARSLDWMDYRIYGIPPLEKDLLWDLFLLDRSPWSEPNKNAISLGQVALPEQRQRNLLPTMVGRQRNRHRVNPGAPIIGMASPGTSLHVALVSGEPSEIRDLMPTLIGEPVDALTPPAMNVKELRPNDTWLIVTYQPPPNMADARMMVVPPQMRVEEDL